MISHGTIRASTLQAILKLIMDQYHIGADDAMKRFYESQVGKCYSDDATGLYGQSALFIFSEFCLEQQGTTDCEGDDDE
jgi:hypothetical protein